MEMGSSWKWRWRMIFIFSQLIITTICQPPFVQHKCSDDVGNYTNSSPFKKNLDAVLNSISTNSQTDKGFYATAGEEPNRATAMALCRGPVPLENCRVCVKNSTQRISQTCPNQKEAAGWYPDCQIIYSNKSIQGVVDNSTPTFMFYNTIKAPDPSVFNQVLRSLLEEMRVQLAETGTPTLKSANGVKEVPNNGPSPSDITHIYGLFDCFSDLSLSDCDRCLTLLQSYLPVCCNASIGARLMADSCKLNYEIPPIYASLLPTTVPPPPPFYLSLPPTQTQGVDNNNSARRIVIIVVSSTLSFSMLFSRILLIFLRKRKRNQKVKRIFETADQSTTTNEILSIEMLQFVFETIELGTNEFSSENKIGEGGFGAVYKGKLPNGREIAVKRLAKDSQQGDVEFRNEVLLVAKLHHRNLVRLLGFCLQKNERLLVYEFVQNASLDHFIFDFHNRILLDWETRYKIINGIARGLLYLHEESRLLIIHRDLKASNILLDEKMNPKIADFGTARMFEVDGTHGNTNRIVGTYGYMAPEYALDGQFSVKSDVFSFGVLVLEIISGQKNICFRNGKKVEDLSNFAWKNWRAGTPMNVIDPKLKDGSTFEMVRCIHIGLLCVQENAADRPTMASLILMLGSFSLTLPIPSQPAFFMHSNIEESNTVAKPNPPLGMAQSFHFKSTPLEPSLNEISITELRPH